MLICMPLIFYLKSLRTPFLVVLRMILFPRRFPIVPFFTALISEASRSILNRFLRTLNCFSSSKISYHKFHDSITRKYTV